MNLIDAISHDRETPTKKLELAQAFNVSEREARRQIAAARRAGVWIVSLLAGGYYITDDPAEWNEFCLQERRRALATFKKAADIPDASGQQMQMEA